LEAFGEVSSLEVCVGAFVCLSATRTVVSIFLVKVMTVELYF
jgi:hypothetical protein